ncbi:MAG TPA: DUF4942 domain-containing protein [Syntrophales bacterium]|jgi:hypothetical protein|nr:DUF4942 domain-containing protein [Syntrophales bacterium]HPL66182.1 DUF4942 domain-containing protein [Smithellaceae bacterium]
MLNNDTFYPTPVPLIDRMIAKIKGRPQTVLDPAAGMAAIIERMRDYSTMDSDNRYCYRPYENCSYSAIEIDTNLQAILDKKPFVSLIDTDFLQYSGRDHFDLIIANPPFDRGDLHLLKAIDIMYRGEIVYLLNAETIRNPYTHSRKELAQRLAERNAEIEFVPDAFKDAERQTDVEVALIYIRVERTVEEDLFAGVEDEAQECDATAAKQDWEVATKHRIRDMVADYNRTIDIGTKTILDYYKNYNKIGKYLGLNCEAKERLYERRDDLTSLVRGKVNDFIKSVRLNYWRQALELKEVRSRMTTDKAKEFESQIQKRQKMDFTESNIRQFIVNLINGYEGMLTDAVTKLFDKFTIEHCYSGGIVEENIHMFNGWKTNQAFKVNKKVIIPIGYRLSDGEGPFTYGTYGHRWKANSWKISEKTRDIDIVMSYFSADTDYVPIADAVAAALDRQESKNIDTTFFRITCYKKGTMHMVFKDDDVLRRFNIVACRAKGWLPMDYGQKRYEDCDEETQAVVKSFEGIPQYNSNVKRPLFATKPLLAIAA